MSLKKNKKAFSLTELLVVLVVIAVLFAALMPIITKRGSGATTASDSVWRYVKGSSQYDSYYDPGIKGVSATAYVGLNPKTLGKKDNAKLVIKREDGKDHIQFRLGDSGYGVMTGAFTVDDSNMLMTGKRYGDIENNYNAFLVSKDSSGNHSGGATIMGVNSFSRVSGSAWRVNSIGAGSTIGPTVANPSVSQDVVAVGKNANLMGKATNSVLLGTNSGKITGSLPIKNTVAVGANVLSSRYANSENSVYMGYNVASAGFDHYSMGSGNSPTNKHNVILNSAYYGKQPVNNTIIGAGAYENGHKNAINFTVAGYGACDSFIDGGDFYNNGDTQPGRKTCIGYNSAVNYGDDETTKDLGWQTDPYDHIFIGGKPHGALGGRAVLEVHNTDNPTVVLNSNLVVRGNLYFQTTNSNALMAHEQAFGIQEYDFERRADRCGYANFLDSWFGDKEWHSVPQGYWLESVAIAIGLAFTAVMDVLTGFSFGLTEGLYGSFEQFYDRLEDFSSGSVIAIPVDNNYKCGKDSDNYPAGGNKCPDLKLSDVRLKENITENTDALEKILQVTPYNYTFKSDKNALPQVGVMAQDLQNYFPQSVSENKDGYLSIRWDEIFFATINSVKALDKKIDSLTSELESVDKDSKLVSKEQKAVKQKIDELNKRVNKLEHN